MTDKVFLYITGHIMQVLLKHKDFFEKSQKDRKELLKKFEPKVQDYLVHVKEAEFMQDLQDTYAMAKGNTRHRIENGLADAMLEFITNTMGGILDMIPLDLYVKSLDERKAWLIEKGTPEALATPLAEKNYQEVMSDLFEFVKFYKPDTPTIIVQSARDTDAKNKKELREHFTKQYKNAFPQFQVAKYLYGGLRVFVDGNVTDESWLGKVQKFTTNLSN